MAVAIKNGKLEEVDPSEIEYEFTAPDKFLGSHANSIPLSSAVQGARIFYGARFANQAMPQEQPEAAWVQNLDMDNKDGKSFDEIFGDQTGNVRASASGVVTKVTPDYVFYKDETGKENFYDLYNNFPLNRKTKLSHKVLKKPGDKINSGDLIAVTNFSDDTGTLALGKNARVALVPYKGFSMDDSVVISEDFAKRLKSEHYTGYEKEFKQGLKAGKGHFKSLFPTTFTKEQLEYLDDDGVVKPGTVLKKGDPVMLGTLPRQVSSDEVNLGKLSKISRQSRSDASEVWDHDDEGVVVDVAKVGNTKKVYVKHYAPARLGDKIVFRQGQKGTIGKIIPKEETPTDEDGNPIDVFLNPMGLPSRVNTATVYELLLGEAARRSGKPLKVPSYLPKGQRWYDYVEGILKQTGTPDTRKIYDPVLGKYLRQPVTVGNGYVLKLHHVAESKLSSRGQASYDLNQQPSKGSEDAQQSKRLSGLEVHGMISAGAVHNLREAATLRGQQNSDYWRMLRAGYTPKEPGRPFIFDKFMNYLEGAGYKANGDLAKGKLTLGPFTDKHLAAYRPVEITSNAFINPNTLEAIPGGLFDQSIVGNNKWGYIKLHKSLPNPAFEDSIQKILGLKRGEVSEILAGRKPLPPEVYELLKDAKKAASELAVPTIKIDEGLTGPEAIKFALENLDLEKVEKLAEKELSKKSSRSAGVRKKIILSGLRKNNLEPKDFLLTRVPVIPPVFRPFVVMDDTFKAGDANELYKELMDIQDSYRELKQEVGDDNIALENYGNVYSAMKALYGYGEPVGQKLKSRGVSGYLSKLTGANPKHSMFQSKMISKTQDNVGRAVVSPNPDLKLDQVGIPEDAAWRAYSTYVQKRLVRAGRSPVEALRMIKERDKQARMVLEQEMQERPVIYSRAPAWHRFNTIAGQPVIVDGHNIQVNPLVSSGLNLDHDGDTMNFHVPSQKEAVEEARAKLMPSKMLFSTRDIDKVVPVPKQEMILGLYTTNTSTPSKKHKFVNQADALDAISKGIVDLNDEVEF